MVRWTGLLLLAAAAGTAGAQDDAKTPPGEDRLGVFGLTSEHAAKLGASWTRLSLKWYQAEPRPGEYRLPDRSESGGIRVLLTLRAVPKKAGSYSERKERYVTSELPEDMEAWKSFVRAVVKRYKGKIAVYQVENEVDAGNFWSGTADEYAKHLRETAEVIRKEDPSARVAMSGFTGGWNHSRGEPARKRENESLLKKCLPYVDIIDVHLYQDYRVIARRVEFFRRLTDKPIWCTELGGPDFRDYEGTAQFARVRKLMESEGLDPDEALRKVNPDSIWLHPERLRAVHADEVIRRYVVTLASGVEKALWFNMRELSPKHEALFHWMGLCKGKTPKPAYEAYRLLASELAGCTDLKRIDADKGVWAFSFRVKGAEKHVLWSEEGTRKVEWKAFAPRLLSVRLGDDGKNPVEENVPVEGEKAVLTLSERPLFLKRE